MSYVGMLQNDEERSSIVRVVDYFSAPEPPPAEAPTISAEATPSLHCLSLDMLDVGHYSAYLVSAAATLHRAHLLLPLHILEAYIAIFRISIALVCLSLAPCQRTYCFPSHKDSITAQESTPNDIWLDIFLSYPLL